MFDIHKITDMIRGVSGGATGMAGASRTLLTVVIILVPILWIILKWAQHEGYF